MNFLKNSIFSRGAGDSSPDWEPENENQMLAVWGSPGSGKTTTAVKLAARLAMQKKDVALLLCDMNTPMLPCICPPGDLDEEHSLGSVLAATHVSESLVRHNCITHKKIRHLTILGMRKGENEYTYPPEAVGKTENGQTVWRCKICGYEYVGEVLPEDYVCPICKHPASDFEKVVR